MVAATEATPELSQAEVERQKLRMKRARVNLMIPNGADEAFIAHLCRIPDVVDDRIPTACTNGRVVRWNPAYTATLNDAELKGLLVEELLHVGLLHIARIDETTDMKRWNIACDMSIMCILDGMNTVETTSDCCNPGVEGPYKDFPRDLHAEAYYELLQQKSDEELGESRGSEIEILKDEDCPEGMTAEDVKNQLKVMVKAAAEHSKGIGTMSSAMSKAVEAVTAAKIPYQRVLRQFRTKLTSGGQSWSRPKRRTYRKRQSYPNRLYLPQNKHKTVGDILVLLDTSGSMPDSTISQALAEIRGIFKEVGGTLHLWEHDTEVVSKYEFTTRTPKFTRDSCGGTSHVRPFEQIKESGLRPDAIICITDCETSYPETWRGSKVFWISDRHVPEYNHPPFGKLLNITI